MDKSDQQRNERNPINPRWPKPRSKGIGSLPNRRWPETPWGCLKLRIEAVTRRSKKPWVGAIKNHPKAKTNRSKSDRKHPQLHQGSKPQAAERSPLPQIGAAWLQISGKKGRRSSILRVKPLRMYRATACSEDPDEKWSERRERSGARNRDILLWNNNNNIYQNYYY